MDNRNKPRPGELYRHFKGKLYQIVSVATHTETREELVVYQALYGDFGIYARPISMFMSKVDTVKYAEVTAVYRFELYTAQGEAVAFREGILEKPLEIETPVVIEAAESTLESNKQQNKYLNDGVFEGAKESIVEDIKDNTKESTDIDINESTIVDVVERRNEDTNEGISTILMSFLDATTFREKLDIVQSNRKDLNDKIINNMAMSIDCTVMEGDMEERISSLIYCLQTRIRFEARRLR